MQGGGTSIFVRMKYRFRKRSRAGHELYRKAGHLTWESDLPMITSDLRETGLEKCLDKQRCPELGHRAVLAENLVRLP